MKIILSKEEVKSFEGFLVEYVGICKESLTQIGAEDMLEQMEGKTDVELVNEMLGDMGLDQVKYPLSSNEDEFVFEIDQELLLTYNEYMKSSMRILNPYACKIAKMCLKYEEVVKKAMRQEESFWNTALAKPLVKIAKGIMAQLDLTELFEDVVELYNDFKSNENGYNAVKVEAEKLQEKVFDITYNTNK